MLNDLRYGLRTLWRNPAVTVTTIVALALGISGNTAMFSLADAFLFKPLALREPERLVMLPGLFETVGARPLMGRVFRPDEDQPGHQQVAVLSFGLWQRRFASDPDTVGRNRAAGWQAIRPSGGSAI